MQLARVTGTVVATQKHEKLVGVKLLLVQPMSADGGNNGSALLAVDAVQAGVGDRLLVVLEGRAAISVVQRRYAPVDAAVVGVVDTLMFESEDDRART